MALSYTWGESRRVRTTKEDYQAFQQEIPLATLPRTFRDAIKVAHSLKYQYIWIDALCIIQDCLVDQHHELAKMGNIYRYADFTIYGERAQSSDWGLFEERDSRAYRPCEVSLSATTTTDAGTDISNTEMVTLATTCNSIDYLERGGWILQEEVLSSRRLIFGRKMAWRCSSGVADETRPVPRSTGDEQCDGRRSESDKLRLWLYAPAVYEGDYHDRAGAGLANSSNTTPTGITSTRGMPC